MLPPLGAARVPAHTVIVRAGVDVRLTVPWYRFRATFGQRWPGYLAIALLVGLVGGVAMA